MDEYTIGIWVWDGVEELDFAGPYEVLAAWARESERSVTVRTVAESTEPIRCSHGLRVVPDVAWGETGPVDLFLLPGGKTRPLKRMTGFSNASAISQVPER